MAPKKGPPRQGPRPPGSEVCKPQTRALSIDYLLVLLTRMTLWKVVARVLSPLWQGISMWLYLASVGRRMALDVRRLAFRFVGFLNEPCSGIFFRKLSYRFWLIRRWHLVTLAVLGIGLIQKAINKWMESRSPVAREKRRLAERMTTSSSYIDWSLAASALDDLQKATMPRQQLEECIRVESRLYDAKLVEQHRCHLRAVRLDGDVHKMMFSLRADLLRNLGNMTNSKLHEHRPIVPGPIREYINEVTMCLRDITSYEGLDIRPEEKLAFLRETRHAFGRTALVLSGGGALGAFHLGMVKALLDHNMLPRVIAGSSVGSIISSLIATRTDAELTHLFDNIDQLDLSFFNNNSPGQLLSHLVTKGTLQDVSVLQHRLKALIGDLTFQEAYERTGRILNVCVCAADTNEPPRLLNYLTAPHALIWSAVAASSAFPLLFHPADLMGRNAKGEIVKYIGDFGAEDTSLPQSSRRWFDGSLEQDLPMRGLSEMFNVNYFLVSQANPHVVPILYLKSKLNGALADVLEQEWKHRCMQLQALLPTCFPSKVLTLVSQTWEGDITVVLPYEYCQVGKAIINPTQESLLEAIHSGERCTWEKLAAIQCNCSIEMTLDQCLNIVVASERQRRRAAQMASAPACSMVATRSAGSYGNGSFSSKTRIPSWLMMSAMGEDAKSKDGSVENMGGSGPCSPRSGVRSEDEDDEQGGSSGEDRVAGGESVPSTPIAIPREVRFQCSDKAAYSSSNDDLFALGFPCGGSVMISEFPLFNGNTTPEQAPFGSYSSAKEFWSRLFPVAACASDVDPREVQALDFIAP